MDRWQNEAMASLQQRVRRSLVPLVAIAILLGAFVGVAASSDSTSRPAAASTASAGDAGRFLTHLADELGVSNSALLEALARAGDATVGDFQTEDLLTPAQAGLARDAIRAAAAGRLESSLPVLARRFAPYRGVAEELKLSVARSLQAELGVSDARLVRSLQTRSLASVAGQEGTDRAQVLAATRRAARRAVMPAVDRGLLTRKQAAILVDGTVAAVAHHW
jgi:hypothetical protein